MGSLVLRPYQERGFELGIKKKKLYYAFDMGLGKTAVILHILSYLGLPALCAAPIKVTHSTWPDEIHDWDLEGEISYSVLHGPKKNELYRQGAMLHLINYEGLAWLYKLLYDNFKAGKPFPYKVLVLDESTYFKDHTTNRFGILNALREAFEYIFLLSGTPSPNSLLDLWAQFYILDGGQSLGKSYTTFRSAYFEKNPFQKYSWSLRPGAKDAIYRKVAPRSFRLRSEDYIHLPERTNVRISVDLSSKERKLYDSLKKDFVLLMDKAKVCAFNEAALSCKLRQFVQGFVYESLSDDDRREHYIHDKKISALRHILACNAGRNAIVLIQFKYEEEMIKKCFPEAKFITGNTSQAQGDACIRAWNHREIPLLVANPRSIGLGLNLQKGGNICIWYALTYSCFDYIQMNKRLHRSGQMEAVLIYHIIVNNSIDEAVFRALNIKHVNQEDFLEYLRQYTKEHLYNG